MQPRITFAIPYYEGSDIQLARTLLEKTIQSVLAQTRDDWAALICHNGPHNDELDRLVKGYKDPRIVLHDNGVNVGAIGNFNVCLDIPTTPLITILHADDQLLPDYTDYIVEAAATHPDVSLYYCRAMIIDINDKPVFSLPDYVKRFIEPKEKGRYTLLAGEEALKKILVGNFIFCPTIAYRKTKLDSFRFSNTWTSVQDLEFMARLLVNGHRFLGVNKVAYAYRRHMNSTAVYRQNLLLFREEIGITDFLADVCQKLGWKKAERAAKQKWIIQLNLLYCALTDALSGRFSNSVAKLGLISGIYQKKFS